MIAHRRDDGQEQDWKEHSVHVAGLCFQAAEKLRLGKMARLIGLLHDLGKGTADWMSYLRGTGSGHPNHAGLGALYVHRLWWERETDPEIIGRQWLIFTWKWQQRRNWTSYLQRRIRS